MKYVFLAILFFSLGYIMPTFAPVLQFAVAGLIVVFLALVLYFYIDTVVYSRIID